MTRAIRFAGIAALLAAGVGLGGCVYDPYYYRHSGVVYSDGNAAVDYDDSYYYSSPGYYYDYPAYYGSYWGPYYGGWGWPYVSLGFYGGYYGYGHHHGYNGPYHPHSSGGRPSGSGRSPPPPRHHR